MNNELIRYNRKKAANKRLSELLSISKQVLIIHYSCESFYDRTDGSTPRITSIAVRNFDSGQTVSFSIHKAAEIGKINLEDIINNYDELEKIMLCDFFEFIKQKQDYVWIHWNMRDINYGFQAIEHRYKVLGGEPKFIISDEKKVDLSKLLIDIYGEKYIKHPRLESFIELNGISKKDFLNGKEEAEAWVKKEFVKLHQSTLRKVDILSNILNKLGSKTLKTETPIRDRIYIHPKIIIEAVKNHWIISIMSILLLIYNFLDKTLVQKIFGSLTNCFR
ncbi:hypothetical protein EV694_2169 [Volucribacter psittacicida]|uniref:Uncharacterized protein n=1 Tax=Volucribacter psittacicida TaxID=203482 RepID=A0A4R1FL98_9PAST|nr:hypothetical protein [Volucribacter psittacicida]TCJ94029.1 hypothetical protein EV694_2169 [Volucribacter psittacicida]